jgi:TonB-dependent SusC/RagA subfamily outer membrane receptor
MARARPRSQTLSGGNIMFARSLVGKRYWLAAVGCCAMFGAACHSGPGKPKLAPASDGVYGSQDGRDAAGAVTKVDGDKLMESSPRTVTDMLVGRFPGVEVYKTPNGGTSIKIRGARSMNASDEPLFVLDGYPQHNGNQSLLDLDPHDIKSIQVLKGAEASAYGSRGANGVILIVTKKCGGSF